MRWNVICSFLGVVYGYKLGDDKFDINLYMTDKKHRSLGLGRKTWDATLEGMGPTWNISLNAAFGKVDMYSKIGFGIIGPKRKLYVGVPNRTVSLGKLPENVVIEDLGKECLDELRGYDLEVCGLDRFSIVRRYLKACAGSILVAKTGDRVVGFSSLDKRSGYHIVAPLYADNKEVAMALMSRLLEGVPAEEPIGLEMFNENQEANNLRQKLGIHQIFANDMTYMFTRMRYDWQIDKVYCDIAPCFPLLWINRHVHVTYRDRNKMAAIVKSIFLYAN